MTLSGTEAEIVNCVAVVKQATKDRIRRDVGFSSEYIGFLCRVLVRKRYLLLSQGRYSLAKAGIEALRGEEPGRMDREFIKEVASEIAKEIRGELKSTAKGIKIPVSIREMKKETGVESPEETIKIKTDFDFPVEDESLALETNIDRIGIKMEKEKSDIDKTVKLFKKIQKKRRKRRARKKRKLIASKPRYKKVRAWISGRRL